MAEADRRHLVIDAPARGQRNLGELDQIPADGLAFLADRDDVPRDVPAPRQHATAVVEPVPRIGIESVMPVAELVAIVEGRAPRQQLRLQIQLAWRLQGPVQLAAHHLPRRPVVLHVPLPVVVADAEVAAGSFLLRPEPGRLLPPKAVAGQGGEDVGPVRGDRFRVIVVERGGWEREEAEEEHQKEREVGLEDLHGLGPR